MRAISRRAAVFAVSLLAIGACGSADGDGGVSGSADSAALQEMSMGADDAPVTLIEYASWTCPACMQFHNDVVGQLKEEYVETGKVKFIFREFPTAPANISVAGFAVARCAGEDKYFDVLDELFERQQGILALAREGGQVKQALQQVAANHGITDPAAFDACLQNSDIRRAIAASVAAGEDDDVSGTPTLVLNGQTVPGYEWRRWEGMQTLLNDALGDEAPQPAAAEAPAETDTPADMVDPQDMDAESGDAEIVEPTAGEAEPE